MTNLEKYLSTFPSMAAGRVRKCLEMQVRVNGGDLMTRAALIESRVTAGGRTTIRKSGERVLMMPDGVFLDQFNTTKLGLDYADFLEAHKLTTA